VNENAQGLVKVIADVAPGDPWERATESLWAEPLGDDRYELRNSPWHARDLHWGDVVRCIPPQGDAPEPPRVVEVLEPSGHAGFSVFFYESTGDELREATLRNLERLGGSWEWYEPGGGRLYAIDLPPSRGRQPIIDLLDEAEAHGHLGWQSSWTQEPPTAG
jgi:hypothetical protein